MSSVVNFDRDLQYVSPADSEVTMTYLPNDDPIVVPCPAQIVKNVGQITYRGGALNIPSGSVGYAGLVMSPPIASSRRVYRVRGFISTSSENVLACLHVGYTPDAGGAVNVGKDAPVKANPRSLHLDETICVSSGLIASPPTVTNENVCLFFRLWNRDTTAYTDVGVWSLSVQDLGTAPPEYDAARR